MATRLGHLIRLGVSAPELDHQVTVVDIHALHDSAQRFVVGAMVNRIFEEKQATGREPLRLIMLDELNKFCPDHGRSPLRDLLVDIAERGRSMGVLLLGAEQYAGSVESTVIRNAAVKLVGRLDAGDLDAYRFLPRRCASGPRCSSPARWSCTSRSSPPLSRSGCRSRPSRPRPRRRSPAEPDPGDIDPFNMPGRGDGDRQARALRLLHTSDWHLGIELGTQSRRPDHEVAIDSLVAIANEFRPDAIVHTGDLFDHARPGADDQALAVDALRRLSAIAPTVVVGGNHDNNVMLDKAWDPLAGNRGAAPLPRAAAPSGSRRCRHDPRRRRTGGSSSARCRS